MRNFFGVVAAALTLAGCSLAESDRPLVQDDPSIRLDGRWALAADDCDLGPDRRALPDCVTVVRVDGRRLDVGNPRAETLSFSVAGSDPTIVELAVSDDHDGAASYAYFALRLRAPGEFAVWAVPCARDGDERRCAVRSLAEVRSLASRVGVEEQGRAVKLD